MSRKIDVNSWKREAEILSDLLQEEGVDDSDTRGYQKILKEWNERILSLIAKIEGETHE